MEAECGVWRYCWKIICIICHYLVLTVPWPTALTKSRVGKVHQSSRSLGT
jgi:hypothetical protein